MSKLRDGSASDAVTIRDSRRETNRAKPRELDSYPEETAGRHMVRVVTATIDDRAPDALARLASGGPEQHDTLHVVDADGRLRGVVRLRALVGAPHDATVGALMSSVVTVDRDADQEEVVWVALRNSLSEVPVTDRDGTLLGAVPALALIAILHREHVEDVDRLTGIRHDYAVAIDAMSAPFHRRVRQRLPWLLVGLIGSIGGALAATAFESLLDRHVALVFFVPTVIYLADAVSTQTEAVVVRGLSLSATPLGRIVLAELATGTSLGLLLALLAIPFVMVIAGLTIAVAVAVALLAATIVATGVSLLLTGVLRKAGVDPAYGAGPLGTVIQDVISLVIYLGVSMAIVGI